MDEKGKRSCANAMYVRCYLRVYSFRSYRSITDSIRTHLPYNYIAIDAAKHHVQRNVCPMLFGSVHFALLINNRFYSYTSAVIILLSMLQDIMCDATYARCSLGVCISHLAINNRFCSYTSAVIICYLFFGILWFHLIPMVAIEGQLSGRFQF